MHAETDSTVFVESGKDKFYGLILASAKPSSFHLSKRSQIAFYKDLLFACPTSTPEYSDLSDVSFFAMQVFSLMPQRLKIEVYPCPLNRLFCNLMFHLTSWSADFFPSSLNGYNPRRVKSNWKNSVYSLLMLRLNRPFFKRKIYLNYLVC